MRKRIVVSISSDIGASLAASWLPHSQIVGTFRNSFPKQDQFRKQGVSLFQADMASPAFLEGAEFRQSCMDWDDLVFCHGTMEPIGLFEQTNFSDWRQSFETNAINSIEVLHSLLPLRKKAVQGENMRHVLFFAGGGTNGAVPYYSAYTLSKIFLIKACELLDAELPDVAFSILGPGWVKTKIHNETLSAGDKAGENLEKTRKKLSDGEAGWVTMEKVVDSCNWILNAPKEVVGGRNFSAAHDPLGDPKLIEQLKADSNQFKLRRYGNSPV